MPAVSTSCSNCAKGEAGTRKGAKNDEAVQEKDEVALGVGELNADKCNGSTQCRGKVTLRCLHLSSARVEAVEDNPRPYARPRPPAQSDRQTDRAWQR